MYLRGCQFWFPQLVLYSEMKHGISHPIMSGISVCSNVLGPTTDQISTSVVFGGMW